MHGNTPETGFGFTARTDQVHPSPAGGEGNGPVRQGRSPKAVPGFRAGHNGRTTPLPALPLETAGTRLGQHLDVPRGGEHTAQIAGRLGYADEHVERLAAEETISLDDRGPA
jgi:hypothetical protein